MRHVDERDAHLLLNRLQLNLERPPELRVQGAERFVEQEHAWVQHERARERHALLLSTGKLVRLAPFEAVEANQGERFADPASFLLLLHVREVEAEGDVVLDGEVREERVVLEYGVDRPSVRRTFRDVGPSEQDPSGRGLFEARDEAERRRLATARGAEQGEELTVVDLQGELLEGLDVAEALAQPLEDDLAHPTASAAWSSFRACASSAARRSIRGRGPMVIRM